MKISLSLKLLATVLALVPMIPSEALAAPADRQQRRAERRVEKRVDKVQQKAIDQNQKNIKKLQQAVRVDNRRDNRHMNRIENRVTQNQVRDWRKDNRRDSRVTNRDIRRWDNRSNQVAVNRQFRNWNDQRDYLKANMRRFNQLAKLNALQQQQLDAQMRSAWMAYHNNNWSGGYGWDYYNEPQFLDYLHQNQPSLIDRILGYLGVGGGFGANNYLYSPDWGIERNRLAQNMFRINQLRMAGRITPFQEQQLLAQMQPAFNAYHNNRWNGGYGWSQYSDPGFIDYLNINRPSMLNTIRSYLGM